MINYRTIPNLFDFFFIRHTNGQVGSGSHFGFVINWPPVIRKSGIRIAAPRTRILRLGMPHLFLYHYQYIFRTANKLAVVFFS